MTTRPNPGSDRPYAVPAHSAQLPSSWYTMLASGLLIATGVAWASHSGALQQLAGAPAPPSAGTESIDECRGTQDTLRLDSLPWPLDSAQAVRRATLALQGAPSLQLPVRVTRYERLPVRVRVALVADVEPRVRLRCGSGQVAIHANGVTIVERRVTAPAVSRTR